MATVNIKIEGISYQVEEGLTILEAAKACGYEIPSLCAFNHGECSRGSCRVCLVEVKGARGLVASCVYPVNEGMEVIISSPKAVEAMVTESIENWGTHPYRLHLAVCPTKNNDRYEWFAEKACEIGFDELSPVIGDHSERRVLKTARVGKILVSAAKQSLKAAIPSVNEPVSVKEFIASHSAKSSSNEADGTLRLIAYCFEDENVPRRSIKEVLEGFDGTEIIVLIGPEGDFSKEEADAALAAGFIPVHLGASRLRTETAALTAAAATYFRYME